MTTQKYLYEVIIGYRKIIESRYQYETIIEKYELPLSFDEQKVAQLREYFLNYIYPHPSKREDLNDAFQNLDNYVKHPDKLLRNWS